MGGAEESTASTSEAANRRKTQALDSDSGNLALDLSCSLHMNDQLLLETARSNFHCE